MPYLIVTVCGILEAIGFGASASRLADRDRWIGWCDAVREKNLLRISNNDGYKTRVEVLTLVESYLGEISTSVIAFATVVYAIYTGKLWSETAKTAKENKSLLQMMFLTRLSEIYKSNPRTKEVIDTLLLNLFEEQYKEVIGVIRRKTEILSTADIIRSLESAIPFQPDIEHLLNDGKIDDARRIAEERYNNDPQNNGNAKSYIGVLLALENNEETENAWKILQKNNIDEVQLFKKIAYNFWDTQAFEKAIEVGKKGLRLAEAKNDEDMAINLKNAITYYATDHDAVTGSKNYKTLAEGNMNDLSPYCEKLPGYKDTAGYVKIVYGETQEIVLDGLRMCYEAFASDPHRGRIFYEKHSAKALARIEVL